MAAISGLEVVVVQPAMRFEAFRIVRGARVDDREVLDSFRSNYELERPPRGVETRVALIQMGISMFERRAQAAATARRFPVIGHHVARVVLEGGNGFAFAPTGPRGHLTVWGRPVQLIGAVVDIEPIDPRAPSQSV